MTDIGGNQICGFHDMNVEFALKSLRGVGRLGPMAVLMLENTVIPIALSGEERAKDVNAALIAVLLKETRALAYTFLSEAWVSHVLPGEKPPASRRPLEDPCRAECLYALTWAHDGTARSAMFQIVRERPGVEDSPVADLLPFGSEFSEGAAFEGRFANLFAREIPPPLYASLRDTLKDSIRDIIAPVVN